MTQFMDTYFKKENYWEKFEERILKSSPFEKREAGFYSLVYSPVNEEGKPIQLQNLAGDNEGYALFTTKEALERAQKIYAFSDFEPSEINIKELSNSKIFMVGDLIDEIKGSKQIKPVMIDPVLLTDKEQADAKWFCHELVLAPLFDNLTNKLMTSNPEEALALLAIHPDDQKRFGIEMVFHIVSNSGAPEGGESRQEFLHQKIKELSFLAPRVPIRRGSGSVYCVLLNLGNEIEETAFIRNYQTFDAHSDIIFVNSNLELLTGEMQSIEYDGEQIDTIFAPIIKWQNSSQHSVQRPSALL